MISISQLTEHIKASRARLIPDLELITKAHALVAAGMAREEIGHEQPSVTIPEVGAYFPAWEPLAESTVEDKASLGFGPPDYSPLLRTGEMRTSISGAAEGLTGVVGSTDPIAIHHEFGTKKMPARPFLSRAVAESMAVLHHDLGLMGMKLLTPKGATR